MSKPMKRKLVIWGFLFLLSGCVGPLMQISTMSPEELMKWKTLDLCWGYSMGRYENVKTELVRRNAVPEDEWVIIDQKKIRVGMTECGLMASWGKPGHYGSINRTVSSSGTFVQWVYRPCRTCRAQYVYTRNGKITSWQTSEDTF